MPDAPGTELVATALREAHGDDAVLGTEFFRGKGAINVAPGTIGDVLETLRGQGFKHLMSVHGVGMRLAQLLGQQLQAGGVRHRRCPRRPAR